MVLTDEHFKYWIFLIFFQNASQSMCADKDLGFRNQA